MIRGIIFDFDGTLIDSYEAIAESLNHVRTSFSLPAIPAEEIRPMVGHGLEKLIAKAVGSERVDEGIRLFRQSYASLCERKTSILPQVKETLDALDRRGYQMAIATNKPSYFARDILRALEIDHLFVEVLGPNDVERPKPDPEMIEIIIMRIGLSPEEIVYVGDMPLDVEVGRRAGVAVYAVPTGSASRDALLEARPDRLLHRFSDLLAFLPAVSGAR
ncbi:MAG TPA: HAD-IA family hydrolase [Candidatus Polarisedimenticolia bacterium]|nr:HAD-IA family hydrolase [Candidatus Polarisedimenticolia bacterium]